MRFDGERYVSGLLGDVADGDIQSEHYHRYLLALDYCVDKDVLDVASGEGYGSFCLGQVARSVVGVDNSAEAVDFANQNYLSDRVSFKHGRAQNLPILSRSVDVVVSFETLEHLVEHDDFMREVKRVLRDDGLLIISSPNRTIYSEASGYRNEFHVRELDRGEFSALLDDAFRHAVVLGQRPISGSVIGADTRSAAGELAPLPSGYVLKENAVFERAEGVPQPRFFVAFASDAPLPPVRASLLHNPALLQHLDAAHRRAADALAAATPRLAELETTAAERTRQVTALEAAVIESQGRIRDLEEQVEHGQAATRAEVLQETARVLEARLAWKDRQVLASRRNSEAHLAGLRQELTGARARSEDLLRELATHQAAILGEQATSSDWRSRAMSAEDRVRDLEANNDALAAALVDFTNSTLWKLTWPARQIGGRVPDRRKRQLRLAMEVAWWSATLQLRSRYRARQAALSAPPPPPALPVEPRAETMPDAEALLVAPGPELSQLVPSEHFSAQEPGWIEPSGRAEFIRLQQFKPSARLAVVLHLYYPELWLELADALLSINEPFDLFVTLVAGASTESERRIRETFPDAVVLTVDNHGRDILPLVEIVRSGVLFNYELVCKLHSKRTEWRKGGDEWRQHLVGGVLGSKEVVDTILRAFDADPDLGIVVAEGQVYTGRSFWLSNERRLSDFLPALGIDPTAAFEKSFAGGSIFWIRPFLFRSLDGLDLRFDDFELEPLANDGTTAHAVERLISLICHDAGMSIEESRRLPTEPPARRGEHSRVLVIANYLPQYHPVPENNAWWGEGFTEWTNVTRAVPLFEGHRQPRLPTDLGFYDLRLSEVRDAQARLAKRYGIDAFSYYYYWFNGRKLLERPIEDLLRSGHPDFPFMICWANEPWTRNWDGLSKETLMPQDYAPDWERKFARDVAPFLRDPRYLRIGGTPVLAIYRVMHIPEPEQSMGRLRAAFAVEGVSAIHLIGGWVKIGDDAPLPVAPADLNLDAYFEFPPHMMSHKEIELAPDLRGPDFDAHVFDYNATVTAAVDRQVSDVDGFRYRGVMMGWDNSARRKTGPSLFYGATPSNFRRWLRATVRQARAEARGEETAVFINAWNEWAEGSYLEPDRDFGRGWLEAVALSVT